MLLNHLCSERGSNLHKHASPSCSDRHPPSLVPQHCTQCSAPLRGIDTSEGASIKSDHPLCLQLQDSIKDRRTVHFRSVKPRKALSRAHYTFHEIDQCWWSHAEYLDMEQIRNQVVEAASSSRRGTSGNLLHTRGLESCIPSTAAIQQHNHKQGLNAVLALQKAQRQSGIHDPEDIARKYRAASGLSLIRALHVATQDEQEVQALQPHDPCCDHEQPGLTCDTDGTSIQKKVTFNPKVRARLIQSLARYSEQEIKKFWYSREERKAIVRSCAVLIQARRGNEKLPHVTTDGDDCIRGLESHIEDRLRIKVDHRKNAYRSVLLNSEVGEKGQCQSRRRQVAVTDLVAASYRRASSQCRFEALERALIDRCEADQVYQGKYEQGEWRCQGT